MQKTYNGPAVLALDDQEPRPGQVQLRAEERNGISNWRGDFRPDDGLKVGASGGVLRIGDRASRCYVQDGQFGTPGHLAILVSNGDPPPFD